MTMPAAFWTGGGSGVGRATAAGALSELLPVEPEVRGLLAMPLLHDSRREARFSSTTVPSGVSSTDG